ncbi:MAG: hypothetical protein WD823_01920 [Sulfuricaulis sp.]|uniref:hypothetical protein n=1 Tax=Sulfuricaulis sp. TaxID=2003553 RepID=UPI0034A347EF
MKIGGQLQAVHGNGRGTRVTASMMVMLLSILLIAIGFQPCCELSPSIGKLAKHSRASAVTPAGISHNHVFSNCVSDKSQDYCGHGANTGPALAKAAPAIVEYTSSSDGGAYAVISSLTFASATRNVLTSVYSISAPPFRLYLRYLHLLI